MQIDRLPLFTLVLTAVLLSAGMAMAQPHGRGGGMGPMDPEAMEVKREARMQAIQQQLNLSEAQQNLLEEHRQNHRQQAKELQQALRTARRALKEELEKAEMDMTRVNQLNTHVKEGFNRMTDHRMAGILEVRKILTPEQYHTFVDLMQQRRPWPGMGKRGLPPEPPPFETK